jgi:hypothetical protein
MNEGIDLKHTMTWLCCFVVFACSCSRSRPDPRQVWIRDTIAYLKTISPQNALRSAVTVTNNETGQVSYFIEQEGLIETAGAQWVFVVSHSEHDDDSKYPEPSSGIGDISVLIDHRGQIWTNAAHPCRGIGITVPGKPPFQSVHELLSVPVLYGNSPWHRMDE